MYYVYILSSIDFDQTYVGVTDDLKSRLDAHNSGKSIHTEKFKPWQITNYIAFADKKRAMSFEKYLKTGSGRAFANKHLR